jgi:putative radical SAM enzyme (TIGR03279 family)
VSGVHIASVTPDSPADGAGLRAGDELLTVNGRTPTDIIEYQQLIDGDTVELVIQRSGEPLQRKIVVTKVTGERLGLAIDSALFDRIRTCDNHCSFCFIYQLPKGLRRSLYVKDDDFRLSFLYGNFTTLTRFTEFDLERVIDEKLSPLYVSIHTTNPSLRANMLRNPRGATSLRWLRELLYAGVEVHGQVVVCPGVNDGAELQRTLDDVLTQYPSLATVSLVPLGVSDFSTETDMRPHTPEEARAVVDLACQYRALGEEILGRSVFFASDEFYLIAGLDAPSAASLPSLDQAENGVGLVASFVESFTEQIPTESLGTGFFQSVDGAPAWGYRAHRSDAHNDGVRGGAITVLTGEYAQPILSELLRSAGHTDVEVIAVENRYFGGNIKVAGLLTGSDIRRVVESLGPDRTYLVPDLCLSENLFLDGSRLDDIDAHIVVVPTTGLSLRQTVSQLCGVPA